MVLTGGGESTKVFPSESVLNVVLKMPSNAGGMLSGQGGLPGSTNLYSITYTIRATENANRFSRAIYSRER